MSAFPSELRWCKLAEIGCAFQVWGLWSAYVNAQAQQKNRVNLTENLALSSTQGNCQMGHGEVRFFLKNLSIFFTVERQVGKFRIRKNIKFHLKTMACSG